MKKRLPIIDVLLATYNGEHYVDEQIRSILGQTYADWRLLIRDDGSNDNTPAIIQAYATRFPAKIVVIKDNRTTLGVRGNFGALLEHSTAEYSMFCDQDDVWLPEKIELTLKKMQELEDRYGNAIPLLVYTDMKVVDDSLSVISASFWRSQVFDPNIGKSLCRLFVSNVAAGCTMMFNKRLRELSVPVPAHCLMHDWWIGLVSVALGKNDYLQQPTMLYRQHEKNVAGAKWDVSAQLVIRKILDFRDLITINKTHLARTQQQAAIFAARYKQILAKDDYDKLLIYANLASKSFIMRKIYTIQYGFWATGFVKNFVIFLIV